VSSGSGSSSPPKAVVSSSPASTLTQSHPYGDIINKVASAYQLHPALLRAIIKVESNYNKKAVSPKGAEGLMQLMPGTAKRFGVSDSFDPEQNITGGAKYLRFLFDEFGDNNLNLVLAGYNAGENAVKKYGNAIPPYKETQRYVKKVRSYYLGAMNYATSEKAPSIYKYVNKDGVVTFTNVPQLTRVQ
jgi:soluble lytic murein transglycosylase-like protein